MRNRGWHGQGKGVLTRALLFLFLLGGLGSLDHAGAAQASKAGQTYYVDSVSGNDA